MKLRYETNGTDGLYLILAHNLLFAVRIFGKTKVIETILTVVYKQGHLVLGFQHT